jgi:hypothetical protein
MGNGNGVMANMFAVVDCMGACPNNIIIIISSHGRKPTTTTTRRTRLVWWDYLVLWGFLVGF